MTQLCADDQITSLVDLLGADEIAGTRRLEEMLTAYPGDPRLHFLHGSFLAGNGDYGAAVRVIRRAVDLAPDFDLARFQLGFLLLTSNEPYAAQEAWGPLHGIARDNYLRIFVEGLCHLIRDEFDQASALLAQGISANHDNLPLNADMQLLIDQIAARPLATSETSEAQGFADEPVSAAQMLLQHAALKATRH